MITYPVFICFELQSCIEHFLLPGRRASLSRTAAYRKRQALLVTPIVTYHTFLMWIFPPGGETISAFFIFDREISEVRIK